MDVLLSHGYCLAEDAQERQIMKPYPPLGLLYVASHLKAAGVSVGVYDPTFLSIEGFRDHVRDHRPPVVGLYCNLMTKQNVLRMISICKQAGAHVVLGGPEPAPYADEYLRRGADIVVVGEGERTLEELITHLTHHGLDGLDAVAGIAFLGDGATLRRTAPRPQITDLSAQPWPDRDAIDMEQYLETWSTHHGVRSVSLITARGCPYTCTWCSHDVFGQTHRRREVQEVADEVEWLARRYDPDQLWYADDVFTIQPRWTLKYADELARRNLRIPFECISRADRLNEDLADALQAMGCFRLWIGSESGSQRILDAMARRTDAADVRTKTKLLQRRGIQVGMFIMLGYEGEEIADIEATVDHLKRSSPDVFLTTVAYPIKGTPYHEAVSDRIQTGLAWDERTDRDLQIAGRHSRAFYGHATRWMVNEVNRHQVRRSGVKGYVDGARMLVNATRGRLGMYMTRNQREGRGSDSAGGRGWPSEDRTRDAW